MPIQTTYTEARANLARLMQQVIEDREQVIIKRRGAQNVVLIAEDELHSLEATAHLLRSPRNAARLLAAFERAQQQTERPQSIEELRQELGLDVKR